MCVCVLDFICLGPINGRYVHRQLHNIFLRYGKILPTQLYIVLFDGVSIARPRSREGGGGG